MAISGMALLAPLAFSTPILMATGHTGTGVSLTALSSVLTLVFVAVAASLDASALVFIGCPFFGQLLVAVFATQRAAQATKIDLRLLARSALSRSVQGSPIGHEVRPALVIWILLPLAYQTDRIIINHLSTPSALASYNIAAQFYSAGFSIIAAGSAALWGVFAHSRFNDSLPSTKQFLRLSTVFGSVGLMLGLCLVLFLPPVSSLLSQGTVRVSVSLAAVFGLLLVVQALHQPSGMLQTDASGLRFIAWAFLAMTAANLALGLALTPSLAAAGPVVASVVAVTFLLLVPLLVRALRLLRSSTSE